jgi:hypothetical protein
LPWKKWREAKYCVKGHEYTPENTTYRRLRHNITRQCRECVRAWKRGESRKSHAIESGASGLQPSET